MEQPKKENFKIFDGHTKRPEQRDKLFISWMGRLIIKLSILPQIIYKFHVISNEKNPNIFHGT